MISNMMIMELMVLMVKLLLSTTVVIAQGPIPLNKYLTRVRGVGKELSPSSFGKVWPDFQGASPLFNCYRPALAKVNVTSS